MVGIIVVFPKAEDAKNIRNILVRNGYQVSAVCTSGAQVLTVTDHLADGIVVCGYKLTDMMYTQLKEYLPAGFDMLLIASEHALSQFPDGEIIRLSLPLKVHDIKDTLDMMTENILRRRKKAKLKPKVRSEEEKKLIQEAKELLMSRSNMSEEEAHRYMQKCSMDSGTNLTETAEMIFTLMKY